MSGPRVTTGDASMQDGSTPRDFLAAVERRFGPIGFDLAAHRANTKHARYFAPKTFKVRLKEPKFPESLVHDLMAKGAEEYEARAILFQGTEAQKFKPAGQHTDVFIPNRDDKAAGLDALSMLWADLCGPVQRFASSGLLWLNCEWADVAPWATKCLEETAQGANILLLTHVAIADWARDLIFGKADVSLLSGRLMFDGKNVLPKDCMLAHFHEGQQGRMEVWDWRRQAILPGGRPRLAWQLG
jgi:hypothetical protein